MILLQRDPMTGGLVSPFMKSLEKQASVLAGRAGSVDWRQSIPDALKNLRMDPEFKEIENSHMRLGLADDPFLRERGPYFKCCSDEEQAALRRLWMQDDVDAKRSMQPAPIVGGEFEKEIERQLVGKFSGDRGRYSEAFHAAGEARPDLLRSYLASAT